MKITAKLGAPLSQVVGESQATVTMPEGATLADVLKELGNRFPEFEAGLKGRGLRKPLDRVLYSLFVNSRPVPFERAEDTLLHDGDRIYLFLPVAGG
jgi:molybdopterin converting factor small subunit